MAPRANTIKVNLFAPGPWDFSFQTLPSGPVFVFPFQPPFFNYRNYSLPAGTYKLTFKRQNQLEVYPYKYNVLVRPYRGSSGRCTFLNGLRDAERYQSQQQQ